jgi:hypothetical protein
VKVNSRPSVIGTRTSTICTAANFSSTLRVVNPGARARSLLHGVILLATYISMIL